MTQWQPIETAPKNQEVLGWAYGDYVLCWWVKEKNFEGWTTGWETAGGYDVGYSPVSPTHWTPLPEAPQ